MRLLKVSDLDGKQRHGIAREHLFLCKVSGKCHRKATSVSVNICALS